MLRFCNQTLIKCFHVLFFTSFWPHLGTLWSSVVSFWGILGALWPALGAFSDHFGPILDTFFDILGLVPQRVAKELPRPPPGLDFWPLQEGAQNSVKINSQKVMPKGAQVEPKMPPK